MSFQFQPQGGTISTPLVSIQSLRGYASCPGADMSTTAPWECLVDLPACLPFCGQSLCSCQADPFTPFQSGLRAMRGGNGTAVTEFVLLGFSSYRSLWGPSVPGVLLVYLVTLLGNSLLVLLTLADAALCSPMYFFLRHFSGLELLYTMTVVPRMLADLLSSCPTILPVSCFTSCIYSHCLASLNVACSLPWPMTTMLPSAGCCIIPP